MGPGSPITANNLYVTSESSSYVYGGSYGGSGGKTENCGSSYYSITSEQVINFKIAFNNDWLFANFRLITLFFRSDTFPFYLILI